MAYFTPLSISSGVETPSSYHTVNMLSAKRMENAQYWERTEELPKENKELRDVLRDCSILCRAFGCEQIGSILA